MEIVNQLNWLLQLDKKCRVDLQVLKCTIGKLSSSLVMGKAEAEENLRVSIEEEEENIQKLPAKRRDEGVAAVREREDGENG